MSKQDQLRLLNAEYEALTGNALFAYASAPTPSTTKYVFQGGKVLTKMDAAVEYMNAAIAKAEGLLATTEMSPGQVHAEIIGVDHTPLHDVERKS